MRNIDYVSGAIVDTAIKIHKHLGPGLMESVYESVLARSLRERGLSVEQQKLISFDYAELHFIDAFRVDLIVEGQVLAELKSVEKLALVHHKQLLTYLRLTKLHVGLLLNFGEATLIDGLRRIVNNYVRPDDVESGLCESE